MPDEELQITEAGAGYGHLRFAHLAKYEPNRDLDNLSVAMIAGMQRRTDERSAPKEKRAKLLVLRYPAQMPVVG